MDKKIQKAFYDGIKLGGNCLDVNLREERIGMIGRTTSGDYMEIVKYNHSRDMWVKFLEHGNLAHTQYYHFRRGEVKNVYERKASGVGYLGDGIYSSKEDGRTTYAYMTWVDMIKRCYDEKYQIKHKSYKNCTVCEEWHNFQNFAIWHEQNFYSVEEEKMNLDKDIILKGNKIYSPQTCLYVPMKINLFFVNRNRNSSLPQGISFRHGKYYANSKEGRKTLHLGRFKSLDEALDTYKSYKKKKLIDLAESYNSKIPEHVYKALINYTY